MSFDKIKSLIVERKLNENLDILNGFRKTVDKDLSGLTLIAFLEVLKEELGYRRNWDMKVFPNDDEKIEINKIKNENKENFIKIIKEVGIEDCQLYWYCLSD